MHGLSLAIAVLIGCAILAIGAGYALKPWSMAASFGLPLPDRLDEVTGWLRLKGVRDIVSGILLLAAVVADGHRMLGMVLLICALIPFGDMSTILAANGRTRSAIGVHGVTAVVMMLAAIPLLLGAR